MLLTNVECNGSESNISKCCATALVDTSYCHNKMSAGVRCTYMYKKIHPRHIQFILLFNGHQVVSVKKTVFSL